ncbi:AAA family ATPase [Plantactinospora sp. S1510]|uniref:AAA family ATPase n=1 Tax=Plantactinospora alkalitolerans TaxID=2789879 RepID=A0ABS0GST6_9ACTN|nr:LuxR family transcriptional regulator [Plantactinospora alkalitolerans]MBF9129250.1 AAA family ATPase [Plantactinospora alkalitolerans]
MYDLSEPAADGADNASVPHDSRRRRADPRCPTRTGRSGPDLALTRGGETRQIERILDDIEGGARFVEVTGDPGIGKTRLLTEVANLARARKIPVWSGAAPQPGWEFPFGGFVDAIDRHLVGASPVQLAGLSPDDQEALASIFPMFPGPSDGGPRPARLPQRYALVRAIHALVESYPSTGGPLVIVLDDLHRADDQTIDALRYLLHSPPRAALLVAFAHRERQTPAQLRAAVGTAPELTRLRLGPLSRRQVGVLLAGRPHPLGARELYRRSGGNPRYLEALTAVGPAAVDAVTVAEFDGLSPNARQTASAASVIGDRLHLPIVAQVAQLSNVDLLHAIDELVERDLVRYLPETGDFTFRHPFVRRTIYQSSRPGWRLDAHARAARILSAGSDAVALAPHLAVVAAVDDADAISNLVTAAAAVQTTAPELAAHWLRAALRICTDERQAATRFAILVGLGRAYGRAGRPADGCAALREALRQPVPIGDAERTEVAALYGRLSHALGRIAQGRTLIRSQLGALADPAGPHRVSLTLLLAHLELACGAPDQARPLAEWAVKSAPNRRPPSDRAGALALLAAVSCFEGAVSQVQSLLVEAARTLDGLTDDELAARPEAALWLGWAELWAERQRDALHHLDRAVTVLTDQPPDGHGITLCHVLIVRTLGLGVAGRLRAAGDSADRAVDVAEEFGGTDLRNTVAVLRTWVAARAGWPARATDCSPPDTGIATGGWFATLGRVLATENRLVLDAGGGSMAGFCPDDETVPAADPRIRVVHAEILTRAALRAGRTALAAEWARRGQSVADDVPLPGLTGLAMLARAQVLAAREPGGGAEVAADAAKALGYAGLWWDAARARALAGAGTAAVDVDHPDDADQGHPYADDGAPSAADPSDADPDAADPDAADPDDVPLVAGTAGEPRAQRRTGRARLAVLTRRERQVADLAGEGLTNREIAAALFVTEKTVEMHLTHVFAKLDVRNRVGMARRLSAAAGAD